MLKILIVDPASRPCRSPAESDMCVAERCSAAPRGDAVETGESA
jgi:hypothetical protein